MRSLYAIISCMSCVRVSWLVKLVWMHAYHQHHNHRTTRHSFCDVSLWLRCCCRYCREHKLNECTTWSRVCALQWFSISVLRFFKFTLYVVFIQNSPARDLSENNCCFHHIFYHYSYEWWSIERISLSRFLLGETRNLAVGAQQTNRRSAHTHTCGKQSELTFRATCHFHHCVGLQTMLLDVYHCLMPTE